jgi:hypothetical protein
MRIKEVASVQLVPSRTDSRSGELPAGSTTELFFAEKPEDVEFAKALCQSPNPVQCLAGACQA